MATKKKPESHPEETANDPGVLKKAAKAIGSAIGTVAVKTGLAQPAKPAQKKVKLASKGKKRLPRKEKKRLQKAATKK